MAPYPDNGFVAKITSKHGKVWIVALLAKETDHAFECRPLDRIPWETWDGKTDVKHGWSPYSGDDPIRYGLKRLEARKHHA